MTQSRIRTDPHDRFAKPLLDFDLHKEIEALRAEPTKPSHGHRQKTLYKHEQCTIALFLMEPGGEIPEHTATGVVSVQPITGELVMNVDGEERRCSAGALIVMAPKTPHDVRADTECAFLLTVSLDPSTRGH